MKYVVEAPLNLAAFLKVLGSGTSDKDDAKEVGQSKAEKERTVITDSSDIQNQADFKSFIEHRRAANSIPFPVPKELDDRHVDILDDGPMRTFIWNDHKDPNQRLIFYLHGGSYFKQPSSRYFTALNEWEDELDAKIVMPIYPKGPEYTYKDSADRLLNLYESLLASLSTSNLISFIGDSAGAGLLMGLADKIAEEGLDQPKNIILNSAWLDSSLDNPEIEDFESRDPSLTHWIQQEFGKIWADGEENQVKPIVSPLYSQNLFKMGRLTLIVGTHEIFYPDNELLHEKLMQLGIDHDFIVGEGEVHIFSMKDTDTGYKMRRKMTEIILET